LTVIILIVVLQAIAYKEKVTKISSKYHMIAIDIALPTEEARLYFWALCAYGLGFF
jgi:hypothetical protein